MRRLAAENPVVAVEVVVEPVPVRDPAVVVPVDVVDVLGVVRVPLYANCHLYHYPLNTLRAVFYLET